jgi:histidinol dehydrogenase
VRKLSLSSSSDRAWLHALREESLAQTDVASAVAEILDDVRARGDAAVLERTARYDGAALSAVRLDDAKLRALADQCAPDVRAILEEAAENIRAFHAPQKPLPFVLDGGRLEQRIVPLRAVGLYVPGGRAAYPSTVLMTALPARVAGVPRVCIATPPRKDGTIPPAIAAACLVAGVDDVFLMGGAQAIAAFAFGTASVPRVDKICGPGNAYVAAAKRAVAGRVGIDMFAGPSEVLVFDDGRADGHRVAWDLLAQAEHDPLAICVCVTTSAALFESLPGLVQEELARAPNAVAAQSIADRGAVVLARDVEEAIAFIEDFAPEHLEWEADEALLARVTTAGAVFVGDSTPEPVGDYFAGPNHTLPTGGTARFASALSTVDFVRRMHVIHWSDADLRRHGAKIARFADEEGLTAHGRAITERLKAPARDTGNDGVVDDPASFVLPAVRRQKAYTLDAPPQAPVKLNQNEGPLDLPLRHKRALLARFEATDFRRYPAFDADRVLEALAAHDGWRADGVLVGNGSNELLTLLFRSVVGAGERVLRPDPCFSLYPLHLDVQGAVQSLIRLSLDDDFAYPSADALVKAATGAKVVLLASPNNPTGSVLARATVERLLAETNALIVVDEAYRQFSQQDFVPLLTETSRLVLLRTFSKAMGLAGLRFGYLLGAPALCRELHKVLLPYNVSVLTQIAALYTLEHAIVIDENVRDVVQERPRVAAALRAKGRRVVENGANFVLMSSRDPKGEMRKLCEAGVLVRDVSSAIPGFLRISIGTPAEHEKLLALVERVEPA